MNTETSAALAESNEATNSRLIAGLRLAIGVAWGLAVSALLNMEHHYEFKGYEALYVAAVAVTGSLPFVLLGSVGRLRWRTLALWVSAAALVAGLYGAYDLWRDPFTRYVQDSVRHSLSFPFIMVGGAWFFVAHHMIEPADAERTLWPSYRRRFESAWRNAFQIALSAAFAGFVYLLLRLGGGLFQAIGIKWLDDLVTNEWVSPSIYAVSFAAGIHLTDVRPGVIRSVRTLVLSLLSYALPLLTVVVAGFLAALVFTGLKPLWKAGSGVVVMLAAAAFLVLLINAAYQDGRTDRLPVGPLRWSARIAAVALIPLTALAAYSLGLRIVQHGLSAERVWGIAAIVVAGAYALGYAWAAVARQGWMRRLERVNVAAAFLMLAIALLLCSPVLDPARLSVGDQLERLKHGKITPAAFDYAALRFDSGRYGVDALKRLAASADAQIATRAQTALRMRSNERLGNEAVQPALSHATIYPKGARLPEDFLRTRWSDERALNCLHDGSVCALSLLDVTGDGKPEVLAGDNIGYEIAVFGQQGGRWMRLGSYSTPCGMSAEDLWSKPVTTVAPLARDLATNGSLIPFQRSPRCPEVSTFKPKAAEGEGH